MSSAEGFVGREAELALAEAVVRQLDEGKASVLAIEGGSRHWQDARARITGAHQGSFMGIPPTGASVDVQLIDIMRFDEAGRVCEHWGVADMLSLMQQLGVVPADAPA